MSHQLFQLPKQTQIDSSVRVTPGAKAYFFATTTTTPQDTYTTSARNVAHAHPVVADANGVFPSIYLDPSLVYKLTLNTSADALIYTVDPVNDQVLSQATIGQHLYPQTAGEQSAGVTPVNYAYAPGDIRRYGTNTTPGTTDMTTAIANALLVSASHRTVFQPETYLTGKQFIRSGATIYFPPGCLILDTGVLQDAVGVADRLLNISSEEEGVQVDPVDNVHIVGWGAKVQLIRANYGSGEQRHAVQIAGDVSNITIEGLECIDAGGDGFHVGGLGGGIADTPERVKLIGCKADNNRRNALSITAAKHLLVLGCEFYNTTGTSPQKGVDIEPDQSGGAMVGDLYDIRIVNCTSENNVGPGFSFVGGPYTAVGKNISVTFENCVDNGSAVNFQIENARHDIAGVVRFRGCDGYNALSNGFECKSSGMPCEVDGMRIFDANQDGNVAAHQGASYAIFSANGTDGSTYGNVLIRDSYARGTDAVKTVTQLISGEATSVMKDIDVEINSDGAATKRASYGLSASQISGKNRVTFIDDTEIATTGSLGSSTMPVYLSDLITNTGAGTTLALNLSDPLTRLRGVRVRARITAAQRIEIDPGSGWTIAGGSQLFSNNVGSEVTLESDGTAKWRIVAGGEGWNRVPIALDNTGAPSVSNGTMFATGGTTTITALSGGAEGQDITILVKHAITFDTTGTTLKGNGGVDITAASGDLIRGVFDGTNWRLTYSDCTP